MTLGHLHHGMFAPGCLLNRPQTVLFASTPVIFIERSSKFFRRPTPFKTDEVYWLVIDF